MKYVLVTCAVLIAGSILLNRYLQNKRYQNPSAYDYTMSESIDPSYHDPGIVENYHLSAAELGNYARSQWFNHKIDVLHPKEKKKGAAESARVYNHKLARVKQLEALLEQSASLKSKGYSNDEIRSFEQTGLSKAEVFSSGQLQSLQTNPLRRGDRGQMVLEVQKLLTSQGVTLKVDGIFDAETEETIMAYQVKNGLFPSGLADGWLINTLLGGNRRD